MTIFFWQEDSEKKSNTKLLQSFLKWVCVVGATSTASFEGGSLKRVPYAYCNYSSLSRAECFSVSLDLRGWLREK